jgi:hypothetical protein
MLVTLSLARMVLFCLAASGGAGGYTGRVSGTQCGDAQEGQ